MIGSSRNLSRRMVRPNFFIVGAPKAGTTALSVYLGEHPSAFMCTPKEPRFFVPELDSIRAVSTMAGYLDLFRNAPTDAVAVGEASVWYLYFAASLRRIRDFNPAARLIVMVRNPVDMAYALHAQSLRNFLEDEVDFETAWRLQERRAQGQRLPANCPHPGTVQYREICRVGQQLQHLFTVFPREQVHVVVFDDLRHDPRAAYDAVLQFLGLPSDGRTTFERINRHRRYRSRVLARFNRQVAGAWQTWASRTKQVLGVQGSVGLRSWWLSLNDRVEDRVPLHSSFAAELSATFEEDVALLGDLLNRDFGAWLSPTCDGARLGPSTIPASNRTEVGQS